MQLRLPTFPPAALIFANWLAHWALLSSIGELYIRVSCQFMAILEDGAHVGHIDHQRVNARIVARRPRLIFFSELSLFNRSLLTVTPRGQGEGKKYCGSFTMDLLGIADSFKL